MEVVAWAFGRRALNIDNHRRKNSFDKLLVNGVWDGPDFP